MLNFPADVKERTDTEPSEPPLAHKGGKEQKTLTVLAAGVKHPPGPASSTPGPGGPRTRREPFRDHSIPGCSELAASG